MSLSRLFSRRRSSMMVLVVLCLAAALVLAACGGGAQPGDTPEDGSGDGTDMGEGTGEGTDNGTGDDNGDGDGTAEATEAVVGIDADTESLDPLTPLDATTTRILRNVYDSLYFREPDGTLIPWLAESSEFNGDTWTITLREGISFHNGDPLNAEAVKANFDYVLDDDNQADTRTLIPDVTGVEATGEYELEITTEAPNPDLTANLTDFLIAAPSVFNEGGAEALNDNPVGTGPYQVDTWEQDQRLVLTKNADYWDGEPPIDQVTFRIIPDTQSRLAALTAGEVDIIPGVPPESMEQIESNPDTRIEAVPGRQVVYIGFNLTREGPLQDQRVRQAINYAIDVPTIIDSILQGRATINAAGVTAINAAYDDTIEPYPYDPEQARDLLEEAGYGDGLELDLHSPQGRYMKDYEAAQTMVQQLQEVGIEADLQTREWGAYLDNVRTREVTDMYLIGLSDRTMTGAHLDYLFHSGRTWVAFADDEIDQAIDSALAETEADARREALHEVQRMVKEYAPWAFLWQQHDIYAASERLDWSARADQQILMYEAEVQSD